MCTDRIEPNSCEMFYSLLCLFSSSFDASPSRRRHRQLSFSFFSVFILVVYAFEVVAVVAIVVVSVDTRYLLTKKTYTLHKYPKKREETNTNTLTFLHAHKITYTHMPMDLIPTHRLNIAAWYMSLYVFIWSNHHNKTHTRWTDIIVYTVTTIKLYNILFCCKVFAEDQTEKWMILCMRIA